MSPEARSITPTSSLRLRRRRRRERSLFAIELWVGPEGAFRSRNCDGRGSRARMATACGQRGVAVAADYAAHFEAASSAAAGGSSPPAQRRGRRSSQPAVAVQLVANLVDVFAPMHAERKLQAPWPAAGGGLHGVLTRRLGATADSTRSRRRDGLQPSAGQRKVWDGAVRVRTPAPRRNPRLALRDGAAHRRGGRRERLDCHRAGLFARGRSGARRRSSQAPSQPVKIAWRDQLPQS